MEVILISGIFMSLFIVVLLLTKKHKALTDKILAVWIAVIGINLLGYYLNLFGYWEKYPHLIGTTAPVPLLHGPLLYLYCLYAFRGTQKLRPLDLLHFAPAIAAYLYMSKFFFTYTAEEKIMLDRGETEAYMTFSLLLLIGILISGLGYAIIAFRLTLKHKVKINNHFSYHEGISLRWLRYCIIGIGLVFVAAILIYLLRDVMHIDFQFNVEHIIYTIMVLFIFFLGYFGIKQENIFIAQPQVAGKATSTNGLSEKYKNSGMEKSRATALYEKLSKIMEEEKPFLEPKLNLAELADRVELSPNHLSQVINQEAGVNFHDFVNDYRVKEFLQRARKNKQFSFLAIALDSGFNSKSSFNHIFKKQTGFSPSQYLAKNDQS